MPVIGSKVLDFLSENLLRVVSKGVSVDRRMIVTSFINVKKLAKIWVRANPRSKTE